MSEQPANTRHSLRRSLISWFLILALLPLTITVWIGYEQAVKGVKKFVTNELRIDSQYSTEFIQNWFDYRFSDINIQAENHRNSELLIELKKGFEESKEDLASYIKSYSWASSADTKQEDLLSFSRHYDYMDDLFLIDSDGNILFSINHRDDLGTNLFEGVYSNTRFSKAVKHSLDKGETIFSDLERYAAFDNQLVGFFTAPVLDKEGGKVGVFAIQVSISRINKLMLKNLDSGSLSHYLVGKDGLLRTPLQQSEKNVGEVLIREISTAQMVLWNKEHLPSISTDNLRDEFVFEYMGPNGKSVFGIHQAIKLPGVEWALISEINREDALSVISKLKQIVLIVFIITVALVIAIATYQSRRITRPISQLACVSRAIAAGRTDQKVSIKSDNEIGVLIDSFNKMLSVNQENTEELERINDISQIALIELEKQKFSLDQHCIVAITNVKGDIVFVNEKFTEISGYKREELLGKNHRLLNSNYHGIDFFKEMYQVISKGDVWNKEVCNRAKDGHLYWVDTTIVPFMDESGKPQSYVAIRTDISARKKVELELIEARNVAVSATEQKSDFLANMSHEIRTPMNGIIGMTGLILETTLNKKQRSYAEITMSSADALLTIINDILDFSKIEAGKLELEYVPFNLKLLAEDVAEIMALKCREKEIEMLLRYKPGADELVIGDPGRVRQILLNLLSNAIKFTEKGHVLLTIELAEKNNKHSLFKVSVSDTGIGIAEDKVENIFNKFDQEDSSTTRKFGGTGLGLSICRQLSQLMGGDVSVVSEKGKGSVFSFSMNLGGRESETLDSESRNTNANLNGIKVLLVDSNEVSRRIIIEQLSEFNLQVNDVNSSKEALRILNSNSEGDEFDVVIIDALMPEMDGESLGREIFNKNIAKKMAKIFLTALPSRGDVLRLKAIDFDGYLTKPTHPSELGRIISMTLSAKKESKDSGLITRHTLLELSGDKREKPRFENAQVLLVEDNPVNIMVATELLEGYGCLVTPAGNGLEAVAVIVKEKRAFDLILMDCQMPEMDGYEATEIICKYQLDKNVDHIPIVAFTANAMKSDEEKCFSAGMDGFISKPINQKALEDVLVNWMPEKLIMSHRNENSDNNDGSSLEQSDADILDLKTFNDLSCLFSDQFQKVVDQHTQSAHTNVSLVDESIQQGDIKTLERAAHSLKGASAQFGAIALNAIAFEMEGFAQKKDLDAASNLLPKLHNIQVRTEQVMQEQLQ